MKVSIAICTYNPTIPYLIRCLEAIEISIFGLAYEFEILLIDNNSDNNFIKNNLIEELIKKLKIKIFPEHQQGLTNARLKAISISKGDYIVFIDDDNEVNLDYFNIGCEIIRNNPFIGAFSGTVNLKYDNPASAMGTMKYHGLLVKRILTKDLWSNIYFNNDTMPCGAGLWVKNDVAKQYLVNLTTRSENISFDRVGKDDLSSGGDNDLAMTAIDVGYGMGLFHNLILTHLIPEKRTSLEYLLKLTEGIEFSSTLLKYVRLGNLNKRTLRSRIGMLIRFIISDNTSRRFQIASYRGVNRAEKKIQNIVIK
jgi:glycosyltransferase involved in cell wall biosynthesis